jgi:hypothetical protein
MITAEEARNIAGRTVAEMVEAIGPKIEELAKAKMRKLRTGYDWPQDKGLWIDGGYNNTAHWREAKAMLEAQGFKVSFFYEERQLVDMFTLIEW